MSARVSCDGDGVVGVPGVVGVVGIQKKGDPTGSTMMVMMGIIPETTSVCLFVESRVSNPETTFVGVESRVSNPETTFVGVESKVVDLRLAARRLAIVVVDVETGLKVGDLYKTE
ncbi:hypothetical protein Tco_0812156 [Tanacetum coccineum]